MLEVGNLTLHYGGSQILYGIDLKAAAGEVTCVMGTNGVGKTSLLKAISGGHPRSGGTLSIDGHEIGRATSHELAQMGVAIVPQGRMIFPLLTVQENLEIGFACLAREKRFVPGDIFELFPVLNEMKHRRGGDLSGGQQQQLAIARAMIIQPKLLLLDEPTEGIQPNIIQQIGKVIEYLRDQGNMAIVLVEQYFDFAFDLADQITVLNQGRVSVSGAKKDLKRADVLASISVAANSEG